MSDEKTEEQIRQELEDRLAETQAALEEAEKEKEREAEIEKMREKRDQPPKLANLKRSKMNQEQKRKVISEYGIDVYEELPI